MPGISPGLFFGGTHRKQSTPQDATIHDPTENSDGDIPYAPSSATKNKSSNNNPKPTEGGYDSDDARLIELKTQGYTDEYVSKKLLEEGRVIYTATSVAGRFMRLKKAAEKAENEMLDDELSDWHIGEDDILQDAVMVMDKKYEVEYEKLMRKKWKEVSDIVAAKLQVKKYTGNACKDRWNSLQDGTALKPIELDSDQEGRAIMRQERVATAKNHRAEAKAAARAKRDAVEAARSAKDEQRRLAAEKKAEEKKAREADQAETRRLREERNRGKEEERAALREAQQLWMAEIHEKRRVRQMEERIYRNLTGKQLNRMRRLPGFEDADEDDEDIPLDFSENINEEEGYVTDAEMDADVEEEKIQPEMEDITSDREEDACASDISSDPNVPAKATAPPLGKAKVTGETLINPRSILTDAELEVLLFERGLPRRTQRETHPQVVARLAAADEALNVTAVSALLEKHFDRTKGTKAEKVRRLAQRDAEKSAAGAEGVQATDPAFKRRYEGYQGEFAELIR